MVSQRVVVVVAACSVLLAAGCASAPSAAPESATSATTASATPASTASATPAATGSETQHVAAGPVGLDAPANWHVRPGSLNPSGNVTFVYLSIAELPSDCQDTPQGGVCYPWPVVQLAPGGIVVAVRLHGMPGSQPPAGGDPLTVGGHPARRLNGSADEACRAIGGSVLTEIVLPASPGRTGWMSLDACLAEGDVSAADAAFSAILASVTMVGDAASP
jgi:hypothetical protein